MQYLMPNVCVCVFVTYITKALLANALLTHAALDAPVEQVEPALATHKADSTVRQVVEHGRIVEQKVVQVALGRHATNVRQFAERELHVVRLGDLFLCWLLLLLLLLFLMKHIRI